MNTRNTHLAALGLVRNPFPYTPDAQCYYWTPHLEEQVTELVHCIESRKGFLLLTAEVGMGKSTLVRRLMSNMADTNVVSAMVFNTFLQGAELLAAVLKDFGLLSTGNMASDIATLNDFLLENHREGRTCLLIIDDAQNLSTESLELIRLLCNLETDLEKLLQILLVGQPELEESLAQHSLRQLRSRLVMHSRLHGLSSTEIADYVKYRLESAGNDGSIVLQTDACQLLWKETQGTPRRVHQIMDRCLYGLVALQRSVIDSQLMLEAIKDSRVELTGPVREDVPPPAPVTAGASARSTSGAARMAWVAGIGFSAMLAAAAWPGFNDTAKPANPPVASSTVAEPQTPAAATPATLQALPTANETTAPEPLPADTCQSSHPWPEGHMVVRQPLGELTEKLVGARLERLEDVCLETRGDQRWMTWSLPVSGHSVQQKDAAARFQLALTHFGSLPDTEIDGVWGKRSRNALMQFQSSLGLSPTGDMDALSGLLLEKFYVNAIEQ